MDSEPIEIPCPQFTRSASTSSLNSSFGKSVFVFNTKLASLKSSQGKDMHAKVKSRKEIEERIQYINNRISYINNELQASARSQKQQNKKTEKIQSIRKKHSDYREEIAKKQEEILQEKKKRDDRIRKNKDELIEKVKKAQEDYIIKNKQSRDLIKKEQEELKKKINQRVREVGIRRRNKVLVASETHKFIIQRKHLNLEQQRIEHEAKYNERVEREITRRIHAIEMLEKLEAEEVQLLKSIKNSSQDLYDKIVSSNRKSN